MVRSFRVIIACAALLAACERQETARQSQSIATSDEKAFSATTGAFHESLRTNDVAGFMSYIDENAIVAPPREQQVSGKPDVEKWYKGFLTKYRTSSLELTGKEVFVADHWAVEFGRFAWGLTPADRSPPIVDHGSYMQVWKRRPDGTWRFSREVWNSAPAGGPKAT